MVRFHQAAPVVFKRRRLLAGREELLAPELFGRVSITESVELDDRPLICPFARSDTGRLPA
jgi:hypothetical protein